MKEPVQKHQKHTPDSREDKLSGIVDRVTFHDEHTGWTILKVKPLNDSGRLMTVAIHQLKVFAGASMEFHGKWATHHKYGDQFKATSAIEIKPATTAALEKYLGSGLIKGVGPATAKLIVNHFKADTLDVFENKIELLLTIPGIASKKLKDIKNSWGEHKAIRDVMIFLQQYGISTLFAVKIFKFYGDKSISVVSENPYVLSRDIYGIGFLSADKIALKMGFERNGIPRIEAGVRHVLINSRDNGDCYLTLDQIQKQITTLLGINESGLVVEVLSNLIERNEIKKRVVRIDKGESEANEDCYYSNAIYNAENYVVDKLLQLVSKKTVHNRSKVMDLIDKYCNNKNVNLSVEQLNAVMEIPHYGISILTGGPGCGKTTTTKTLVDLFLMMKLTVTLAAPTGRAAQRMTEVIGIESRTIHRLLGHSPEKQGFRKDEDDPIETDILIVDEFSMMDILLTSSLLKAIEVGTTQVLIIGDPDQLPSVGAGNVLGDLLDSGVIPTFQLNKVFRQAEGSSIIRFAHKINKGEVPPVRSPVAEPSILKSGIDCFFFDAEEATLEQIRFLGKARKSLREALSGNDQVLTYGDEIKGNLSLNKETGELELKDSPELAKLYDPEYDLKTIRNESFLNVPENLKHIDILKLSKATNEVEELKAIMGKVHPWSTIHYGLTAGETLLRLYTKTIPEILGNNCEIQVLSPQTKGTLGTLNLNKQIQEKINPNSLEKVELNFGDKVYREGDRVIQTRNNYDLGVFNGDIGKIKRIDLADMKIYVEFDGRKNTDKGCVEYNQEDLSDLNLAYAITIHKSQGSEFQAIIIPITLQHYNMLYRNLIYTGLTRARKIAIFVGSRKALSLAVKQIDQRVRQTTLKELLRGGFKNIQR